MVDRFIFAGRYMIGMQIVGKIANGFEYVLNGYFLLSKEEQEG